jgi:hypothetical protein
VELAIQRRHEKYSLAQPRELTIKFSITIQDTKATILYPCYLKHTVADLRNVSVKISLCISYLLSELLLEKEDIPLASELHIS